jgi:signal transduction histidine kinase
VTIDLTDQVKAEEAVRNALNEAEKATRAKSQFIATMSHEFRTPLNAILGFSEMLRGEYFGPLGAANYIGYAKDIHDSGEHLLALVNDILDIAAIEAGKRSLQKEEFDIAELLRDCMRSVEHQAADRNIRLVLKVPNDTRPLSADRKAVAQIFLNILANAVKFTQQEGTIGIDVKCQGDALTVCVSDTGVGISGDLLSRVTEPFAKGQSNPHVTESGTGLGLSIVKSLVDAHGGELTISSQTGIGTAVYVTLPF